MAKGADACVEAMNAGVEVSDAWVRDADAWSRDVDAWSEDENASAAVGGARMSRGSARLARPRLAAVEDLFAAGFAELGVGGVCGGDGGGVGARAGGVAAGLLRRVVGEELVGVFTLTARGGRCCLRLLLIGGRVRAARIAHLLTASRGSDARPALCFLGRHVIPLEKTFDDGVGKFRRRRAKTFDAKNS